MQTAVPYAEAVRIDDVVRAIWSHAERIASATCASIRIAATVRPGSDGWLSSCDIQKGWLRNYRFPEKRDAVSFHAAAEIERTAAKLAEAVAQAWEPALPRTIAEGIGLSMHFQVLAKPPGEDGRFHVHSWPMLFCPHLPPSPHAWRIDSGQERAPWRIHSSPHGIGIHDLAGPVSGAARILGIDAGRRERFPHLVVVEGNIGPPASADPSAADEIPRPIDPAQRWVKAADEDEAVRMALLAHWLAHGWAGRGAESVSALSPSRILAVTKLRPAHRNPLAT